MQTFQGAASPIEWGVACKAIPGENISGDHFVVRPFKESVLVAVIDGLGHGEEAHAAAKAAEVAILAIRFPSAEDLIKQCHEALRGTRGAVMSAAFFYPQDLLLKWTGVGNVEGVLRRAKPGNDKSNESLITRGGTLGSFLPPVRVSEVQIEKGDLLILATDGLRSEFAAESSFSGPPARIAEDLLKKHGRGTDDALVLVARYLGRSP